MAIRPKKTEELPPTGEPLVRPLTDQRNQEREEIAREQSDLHERIMSHGVAQPNPPPPPDPDLITGTLGPTKPDATPVGGGQPPEPPKAKPPIEPPTVVPQIPAGEIPSVEQVNAELAKFKPRNKQEEEGFAAIRGFATKWHTTAKDLDTKVKERDARIRDLEGKVIPEAELNRLRHLEKMAETHMVEQLPEWGEYDKGVAEIDTAATAFLAQSQKFPDLDKWLEIINKKHGGLSKLASSNEKIGNVTGKEWFKKQIFDKLDDREKIRLEQLLATADAKRAEKETKLNERKSNAKQTLEAEQKKSNEALRVVWDETVRDFNQTYLPKFDLPTTKPMIAATDTPEEKKEKQKVIDIWDAVEKGSNRPITTTKEMVEMRLMHAGFPKMVELFSEVKKQRDEYKTQAEDRQDQLDKIRGSKRLSRQTVETPIEATQTNPLNMTTEQALAAANFPVAGSR